MAATCKSQMPHPSMASRDGPDWGGERINTDRCIHRTLESCDLESAGEITAHEAQHVYYIELKREACLLHTPPSSRHCYYTQIKEGGRIYGIQLNKKTGLANLGRNSLCGAMAFRS